MQYKQNAEITKCEWRTEVYTETGADYSLPDYNGDVRKILFTEAKVRPSGSFENGENIDFSGIIVYNLVYSDSENRINSVSFTSDYDQTVKCAEGSEPISVDTSVAGFSVRLLGPRKLSAKATLNSKILLARKESQSVDGSAFDGAVAPEAETLFVNVMSASCSERSEREYAEELARFDGVGADSVEVIYSNAECVIDSAGAEEGGVSIRGSIKINALIKCDSEEVKMLEKTLKVDEVIDFASAQSAERINARADVSSVRCSLNADESGTSLVVNVIAEYSAESYGNDGATLTTDVYRCDGETENEYVDYKYLELLTLVSEKDEHSSKAARESIEMENIKEVICLGAQPKISSVERTDDGVLITGEIQYSGIAVGVDEKENVCYLPFKNSLTFDKNVNINCQNAQKMLFYPVISCFAPCAVIDENEIYVKCLLQTKLFACEEKCEKILLSSELVSGSGEAIGDSKIVVYYPEKGETLFEIAKKFHTTVEKISTDNSISRSVSSDGEISLAEKKLLIY